MSKQYLLGDGDGGEYYLMGLDIKEKKLGVPLWGWGVGALALLYYFKKHRR